MGGQTIGRRAESGNRRARSERGPYGFPVCRTEDDAAELVLYRGELVVTRVPLRLRRGGLRILRP